jgi:nucleotide-binding universal stress UspA family protein
MASRLGASLDVIHVVEPAPVLPVDAFIGVQGRAGTPLAQFVRERSQRDVRALVETTPNRTGVVIEARVLFGDPRFVIIEEAARGGHDLVVMGTHGRTGLLHVLVGSVAEAVVRRAPCPVLTVRESGEHDVVREEAARLT